MADYAEHSIMETTENEIPRKVRVYSCSEDRNWRVLNVIDDATLFPAKAKLAQSVGSTLRLSLVASLSALFYGPYRFVSLENGCEIMWIANARLPRPPAHNNYGYGADATGVRQNWKHADGHPDITLFVDGSRWRFGRVGLRVRFLQRGNRNLDARLAIAPNHRRVGDLPKPVDTPKTIIGR
jgi:hypothetical protein